jgi:hypothetical protein
MLKLASATKNGLVMYPDRLGSAGGNMYDWVYNIQSL